MRGTIRLYASAAEHEVKRAQHAQPRPEEIELHRLLHIEQRERDEDRERDHLLQDFELRERQRAEADAVRRHLQEVLEERRSPSSRAPRTTTAAPPRFRRCAYHAKVMNRFERTRRPTVGTR